MLCSWSIIQDRIVSRFHQLRIDKNVTKKLSIGGLSVARGRPYGQSRRRRGRGLVNCNMVRHNGQNETERILAARWEGAWP